jgi:hypothetical protein
MCGRQRCVLRERGNLCEREFLATSQRFRQLRRVGRKPIDLCLFHPTPSDESPEENHLRSLTVFLRWLR